MNEPKQELSINPLTLHEGLGDNLKATLDYGGMVSIEVEEPWAGDTETGFGRSGAIRLTREQAQILADWLAIALQVMPEADHE